MSNVVNLKGDSEDLGKSMKDVLLEEVNELKDEPFRYILIIAHPPKELKDGGEVTTMSILTHDGAYATIGMLDVAIDIIKDSYSADV
jgi:hypothetical protein